MTDSRPVSLLLAAGACVWIGDSSIWRSPLFIAQDSVPAMFVLDSVEPGPGLKLEVRASQLVGPDWVDLLPIGGGGGLRSQRAGSPATHRRIRWIEFEPPVAAATRLKFDYWFNYHRLGTEEAELTR